MDSKKDTTQQVQQHETEEEDVIQPANEDDYIYLDEE
jgi:hypothetical protein